VVCWSWVVNWGRLVDNWGWVVDWSRLVGNWGWMVWFIVGLSFVSHISNISRVGISSAVGHNLGAAIRKSHTVLSMGGVAIPVLVCSKVGARVVISNSIAILVDGWTIIRWFLVCWSWVVWGWLVHNWGWVVDWSRLVHNWSWVVDWGRLVNNRGWVVDWGRVVWSWLVHWGWVVDWGWLVVSWAMNWSMSWSMDSSAVLLSSIWVVDVLWGSMGLAGNHGCV